MMGWEVFNAASMFPGPTQKALEGAGEAAETIGQAAETIASGIETVSDFLYDITDPVKAAIQLAIDQLKAQLTDAMNTGLYLYYDTAGFPFYSLRSFDWASLQAAMDIDGEESERRAEHERENERRAAAGQSIEPYRSSELPLSSSIAHGFTGWRRRWEDSFFDQGDRQRPAFSDQAQITCVLLMAGTPSLDALPALLRALGLLLGIQRFKDMLDRQLFAILTEDAKAGDTEIHVDDTTIFAEDRQAVVEIASATKFDFVTVKAVDHRAKTLRLYDPLRFDHAKGVVVGVSGLAPPAAGASKAPDWKSRVPLGKTDPYNGRNPLVVQDEVTGEYFLPFRLGDLPPMREVERQVKRLIGLLEMAGGFVDLLKELADALVEKAQQLRDLAQQIQDLIELIEAILSLSGVFIIKLESSTGPQGLFDALDTIESDELTKLPLPPKSFVVGACLLAGTNNFGPIADALGA